MKKTAGRRRVDVNLQELDSIIDRAMQAPLSESDGQKLKNCSALVAEKLVRQRSTEKTRSVLEGVQSSAAPQNLPVGSGKRSPAGQGRNGATMFTGATRVAVRHEALKAGDSFPACGAEEFRIRRGTRYAIWSHGRRA